MTFSPKTSMFAVIPGTILFSKKLNDATKLMYGHITNLCNEKGYCYASNAYLVGLTGKSLASVKRSLKDLADSGYIHVAHVPKNSQDERRITVCHYPKPIENEEDNEPEGGGGSKMSHRWLTNEPGGGSKMSHINNNIEYNNKERNPPIPPFSENVPAEAGELRDGSSKFEFSEEVKNVTSAMITALKQAKPNYKSPKVLTKFLTSVEQMMRLDNRSAEQIVAVFRWAVADSFWADKMFKPNPAAYLREKFDQLEMKMNAKPPEEKRKFLPSSNQTNARKIAQEMLERARKQNE